MLLLRIVALLFGGVSAYAPAAATTAWLRPGSARPRLSPPCLQQGPLEEGFKELMPFSTQDGNVSPELVARIESEVLDLTGVGLEDLINPAKVVNYERERLLLEEELAGGALDPAARAEKEARLDKVVSTLFSEKRAVFKGWLKAVFIGQAVLATLLSGLAAFDAYPGMHIDLSIRALGFWAYWLFIIPSLRARRPRGWEKKALDIAFLGSPLLTKDPGLIWSANFLLLGACYAYGLLFVKGTWQEGEVSGGFTGPLKWLDFGSGQERGVRGAARERLFAKNVAEATEEPDQEDKT